MRTEEQVIPMTTMIERVANAIKNVEDADVSAAHFVPHARAAIAAMREPTDDMFNAAYKLRSGIVANYQAMIDAAIKKEEQHMTMIERVARAIADMEYDDGSKHFRGHLDAARAAIAAMREPSEAMKEGRHQVVIEEWQDMIDAALEEQ